MILRDQSKYLSVLVHFEAQCHDSVEWPVLPVCDVTLVRIRGVGGRANGERRSDYIITKAFVLTCIHQPCHGLSIL